MKTSLCPRRGSFVLIFLLAIVLLVLRIASMQHVSATFDEGAYAFYGVRMLNFHPEKPTVYDSAKMPVSLLNVLPTALWKSTRFPATAGKRFDPGFTMKDLELGRYVTIFFSLLAGFYVFRWAKELYGQAAGIFSFFLYTFCPNLIAHSQLVTTDCYVTGMILIATYYFWKFVEVGGWKRAALSASTLGVAQLAKYTGILLYPIYLIIAAVRFAPDFYREIREKKFQALSKRLSLFLKYVSFFIVTNLLIINAGFFFKGTGLPLGQYRFESDMFRAIQSSLHPLGGIPVWLPKPYLQGLDWVRLDERNNITFGSVYLLGKLQQKGTSAYKGFKDYYFIACFFKIPIAIQLFLFMALLYRIRHREKFRFSQNEFYIFLPVLFFMNYFSFFYRAQTGIRYLLPIFPLLYIFCGCLLKDRNTLGFKFKIALSMLSIYLILSVMSYYPHYLAYFNEWLVNRKNAYKILADSNLDWGQSDWYLTQYLKTHPGTIVRPKVPTAGRIVVSASELTGRFYPERYRWLRENFEPVDHIAYSFLVFDIKPGDLRKLVLTNN